MVAPTLAYLCHRECRLNGIVLAVGGGRTARIATTTASGYFNPLADHSDIAPNPERVLSLSNPIEPESALDEFELMVG